MNTKKELWDLICLTAKVPSTHICPTTNIYEDLEMDAIDYLSLMLKLEHKLGLEFPKEEVEGLETVKEIHDCLKRHVQQHALIQV